eukprot:5188294-Prymnesium_polylepis.1
MGHWGQCPHTPGMAGHCLVTLGGHRHTTTTTFGTPNTVFDASRVAMGHWGQCPHTPGRAGHCLVTLGGHTRHTPPRPHLALPTPYLTARIAVRVSY